MKTFQPRAVRTLATALFYWLALSSSPVVSAAWPALVDLQSSSGFVLLSKAAITDVPTSTVTGNVGASPITGAAIGLACVEVTGTVYSTDASGPLPCRVTNAGLLTTAVTHMEAAYTDAAGRLLPTLTELGAGNIGGLTITPGLYKWSTNVSIPTDVTLSGSANDVWIFQVAGDLSIASAQKVLLVGGARASNVFWQVGGPTGATLGTTSIFNGTILSLRQVILQTGATLNGRAMAQTQITLDQNTVALPPVPATLRVVKQVSGVSASIFNLRVKLAGVDVSGSPATGTGTPGTPYSLLAGTYVVSEDANASYTTTFTGDCSATGSIVLTAGADKTCTVVNTAVAVVPPPSSGGGGGSLSVDFCPAGDFTNSYYDNECGSAPIVAATGTVVSTGSVVVSTGTVVVPVKPPVVVKPTTPVVKPVVTSGSGTKVVRAPTPFFPTKTPKLPNTGVAPDDSNFMKYTALAFGAITLLIATYFLIFKRRSALTGIRKE